MVSFVPAFVPAYGALSHMHWQGQTTEPPDCLCSPLLLWGAVRPRLYAQCNLESTWHLLHQSVNKHVLEEKVSQSLLPHWRKYSLINNKQRDKPELADGLWILHFWDTHSICKLPLLWYSSHPPNNIEDPPKLVQQLCTVFVYYFKCSTWTRSWFCSCSFHNFLDFNFIAVNWLYWLLGPYDLITLTQTLISFGIAQSLMEVLINLLHCTSVHLWLDEYYISAQGAV